MDGKSMTEWLHQCAQNPGADWRVLARDADRKIEHANEGVFDELVVDHWFHLERLDDRTWWMRVGDARLQVFIAQDGTVTLDVQRGFYEYVRGKTETVAPEE